MMSLYYLVLEIAKAHSVLIARLVCLLSYLYGVRVPDVAWTPTLRRVVIAGGWAL